MILKRIVMVLHLVAMSQSIFALDAVESKILDKVVKNQQAEVTFIEKTVNINTGTMNAWGIRKLGEKYTDAYKALGFQTEWRSMPAAMQRAGHFFAYHHGQGSTKILLIGHLDTVFRKDSPFQKFSRQGNIVRGPGVIDMKGGNAVMLFALQALSEAGVLSDANISVALMGDEEKSGMPQSLSRKALSEMGRAHEVALGFEGATSLNSIVTERRGIASWTLSVQAKQGHSSHIGTSKFGSGAILSSTDILGEMRRLSLPYQHMSFNPGLIAGGDHLTTSMNPLQAYIQSKNNIIASKAWVSGEVRYLFRENLQKFSHQLQQYTQKMAPPIKAQFVLMEQRGKPPMSPSVQNMNLFEQLKGINRELGLGPLQSESPRDRGAADISFVPKGVAALDGLGAVGGGDHSVNEYMMVDKTIEATKRVALLIYRLGCRNLNNQNVKT